ncbi:SDR family NAD(P)-dependent oxidoreductase [Puniceicoccales bacterium CK1056]|uniref:SDR family NAD(P)-dependent oxidoreductase n=1 Tax=Oceanipulchritudo coccoides TaxID=2706888 RepID=A0A6B2LZP5_9BACT|nr:SDR family oxidoreductase [Oceanipulchritudo coccoides]NDV62191.1 SDR family NAD(P)-dependent oxidoreductase [Oceanipulchritudo coccoides]
MDIAIVTGASSSLGLAISKRLIQMGFRVYGLGGDYTDCSLQNVNFKPYPCDLGDPEAVEAAAQNILNKEKGVFLLINNAKYYGKKQFFEADRGEIQRVLNINLLCPLILTRALADSLVTLQGFLIQLGSPYAETSRGGPVGAAASGGLKWMGEVLFHDLRDHGVKVCHLSPEPNRGRDPRTVARPGARVESAIDPEAVAQAVEQIIQSRFGNIVTEMVLRPLRVSEPEFDPVIRLPYPKPKPVPYTVPREMIEAEEQLENEEIDRKQNQRRKKQQTKKRAAPNEPKADKEVPKGEDEKERPKRKRARKAKSSRTATEEKKTEGKEKQGEKSPRRDKPAKREHAKKEPTEEVSQEPEQKRRRPRRKPRPPMTSVGFLNREKEKSADSADNSRQMSPDKPAEKKPHLKDEKHPAKKAPKRAVKKVAKKAVKKAATAKKAVEKSTTAKKAAPKKRAARKTAKKDAAKSV